MILIICVFLGWQFQKQYILRTRHYTQLLDFCAYCKNQIAFLNSDRESIIHGYVSRKECILKQCFLGKKIGYLKDEENEEIHNFLNSIGSFAVEGELKNIDFYITIFTQKRNICFEEEKSKGVLCLKMGLLLGLLLCIVLL